MALLDAQERVTNDPGCTVEALELSWIAGVPSGFDGGSSGGSSVGCETVETVTVALRVTLPPDPVHVIVYVAFEAGCTPWLPLSGLLPLQAPAAEHELALLLDQLTVDPCPDWMLDGFALMDRVGAGVGVPCPSTLADMRHSRYLKLQR